MRRMYTWFAWYVNWKEIFYWDIRSSAQRSMPDLNVMALFTHGRRNKGAVIWVFRAMDQTIGPSITVNFLKKICL